ncbi:DUF1801 domain-containing protein [Flavihumibacter sp. RY-1]|uniref:DUF1801 domain-containing protein n=1 Tax=Flavihumibacter fluminis TaxID=2909236 RepID=A0ABS9BHR1_9BACT|nr:DUF1801 domain-containing protein [Flavihumibacter fluminis]MCF1715257.1 DUF1801 domain-containing protein [Flavihumibacter fluminis]
MSIPADVADYFLKLPEPERKALEAISQQIQKLVPSAQLQLSRGVPFFYYKGKRAVGFRSSKTHLSFFIMEGTVLNRFREELIAYDNSTTVIRFKPDKPLHPTIIKKLVLARIEEIDAKNDYKK